MSKILRMLPLFVLLAACSGLDVLNNVAPNPDRGTQVHRDRAFGDLPRQSLDIYVPDTEGLHPILIFVHGGSWNTGSKEQYAFAGRRFAGEGYTTVVVNYRHSSKVQYPGFVEDVAAATAWIYENAAEYDANPERLFLVGHSAGAYNAVQMAVASEFLQAEGLSTDIIDGIAGITGPYDFLPSTLKDVNAAFGKDDDGTRSMPVNRITADAPPMLLIVGGKDKTVYPHNAVNLAAKLRKAGVRVKVITYPEADHIKPLVAIAFPKREPTVRDITAFFDSIE